MFNLISIEVFAVYPSLIYLFINLLNSSQLSILKSFMVILGVIGYNSDSLSNLSTLITLFQGYSLFIIGNISHIDLRKKNDHIDHLKLLLIIIDKLRISATYLETGLPHFVGSSINIKAYLGSSGISNEFDIGSITQFYVIRYHIFARNC